MFCKLSLNFSIETKIKTISNFVFQFIKKTTKTKWHFRYTDQYHKQVKMCQFSFHDWYEKPFVFTYNISWVW